MAIRSFKEILNNKAFRISSKDRAIFEQGTLQSFFGFSNSDMIEFILYDANDNQLPQGEFGELVRYIPLSSDNIKDYFLISDGTLLQSFSFPSEYFIDVERLCNEAGYSNGIFKTQITLLNKRVGFDSPNEKLWIKEISPSRTEIKLLPIRNEVSNKTDLLQRFRIMVDDKDFRDDVIPYVSSFIESINPSEVSGFIKQTYGEKWYNTFVSEFGIKGLDNLTTTIYNKFVEAMLYEFSNRVSYINDPSYGKKKTITASLQLDKTDVFRVAQRILVECVQKYLPQRTIQKSTEFDLVAQESIDDVGTVLKRRSSDVVVKPKEPVVTITKKKEPKPKELQLEKEIKKEVPVIIPKPTFAEPKVVSSRGSSGGGTGGDRFLEVNTDTGLGRGRIFGRTSDNRRENIK